MDPIEMARRIELLDHQVKTLEQNVQALQAGPNFKGMPKCTVCGLCFCSCNTVQINPATWHSYPQPKPYQKCAKCGYRFCSCNTDRTTYQPH